MSLFFGLVLFVHVIMEQVTVGLGVLYPNILRKLSWILHPFNGFVVLTLIILLAASYAMTQHYPDSSRRVTPAQRLSIFSKALMGITVVLAFITQIPALKSGFDRASSTNIPVAAIIRVPGSANHSVTSLTATHHTDITTAISTSTMSTSGPVESFLIQWKDEAQEQRKEDTMKVEMYMEQVGVMFDRQSEVLVRHFEAFSQHFEIFGRQLDLFQASFAESQRRTDMLQDLLSNVTNSQVKSK